MIVVGYVPNGYWKIILLILYLYTKLGCLQTAHFPFNNLVEKDLYFWNSVIASYVQEDLEDFQLDFCYEMGWFKTISVYFCISSQCQCSFGIIRIWEASLWGNHLVSD